VNGLGYKQAYTAGGETRSAATSWATASNDLQAIINSWEQNGAKTFDEIWVEGMVTPKSRAKVTVGGETWEIKEDDITGDTTGDIKNLAFVIPQGLKIYGGFTGTEEARNQRTDNPRLSVLSGVLNDDANAYHVVLMADILHYGEGDPRNTVLDGLTISGGVGADKMKRIDFRTYTGVTNNIPNGIDQQSGGGLYLVNASPVLENLRIENNRATAAIFDPSTSAVNPSIGGGGGIYNLAISGGISSPRLSYVVIYNNQAAGYGRGGGMYNQVRDAGSTARPVLSHVTIEANQSTGDGGGLFNITDLDGTCAPDISDSEIFGNLATFGGACYDANLSTGRYTRVKIRDNIASRNGGGLTNTANSRPVLTNVTITGNMAAQAGGVENLSQYLTMTNVTISNNYAGNYAGGILNSGGAILTNVIIEKNSSREGGGIYNELTAGGTSRTVMIITNGIIRNNITRTGNSNFPGDGAGIFNTYSGSGNANLSLHLALTNVLIAGNTASNNGGGIYNENTVPEGVSTPGKGISVLLNNVTIANNTADSLRNNLGGGGICSTVSSNGANKVTVRANNSIIWGNTTTKIAANAYNNLYTHTSTLLSLYTSLMQSGTYTDGDALTYPNKTASSFSNSLFTNFDGKDYTLNAGVSGLIDGGNDLYLDDADALLTRADADPFTGPNNDPSAGALTGTGTRETDFKALLQAAVFGGSRPIDRDAPPATGTGTASHGERIKDGDGDSDGDGDPDAIIDLGAYEK
jgi:hypothetical protein